MGVAYSRNKRALHIRLRNINLRSAYKATESKSENPAIFYSFWDIRVHTFDSFRDIHVQIYDFFEFVDA